jgi:DNA gyrase subunit B
MEELSTVEAVRKRPGMYVGDKAFFGFIQYLVCPVALLLSRRATRVAVAVDVDGFVVESDAVVPIRESASGRLLPFENMSDPDSEPGHHFEGTVLNALSERLTVEVRNGGRLEALAFRRGVRESRREAEAGAEGGGTILRFAPDASIFTVLDLSPEIFRSYLRRLSFLHRGVRFSLAAGGEVREYYAGRGILDLFEAVAAPYQILHEPVHFAAEEGDLRIETAFAYQSWSNHAMICFINNGRAVEGGTHEQGLKDALDRLYRDLKLPKASKTYRNGVVGVTSIRYPGAVWEGCIKARVGSPELREKVRDLFLRGASDWLEAHPDVARRFPHLRTFQFPDAWSW